MAVRWDFNVNRNRALPELTTLDVNANPRVPDNYWQKLVKIIPTEVVALYTGLETFVRGGAPQGQLVGYEALVFAACLVLVVVAMVRLRKVDGKGQIALALAAYVIWVYAQGGVFAAAGCVGPVCYQPFAGGFVAFLFAGAVSIYNPNTGA